MRFLFEPADVSGRKWCCKSKERHGNIYDLRGVIHARMGVWLAWIPVVHSTASMEANAILFLNSMVCIARIILLLPLSRLTHWTAVRGRELRLASTGTSLCSESSACVLSALTWDFFF